MSATVLTALSATAASAATGAHHATTKVVRVTHHRARATTGDIIITDNGLCIDDAVHGSAFFATDDPNFGCATFTFKLGEKTPNGNNWWYVKSDSGCCLNYLHSNGVVYADSCPSGDTNEMWYNHVRGELINLAGNNDNHHDTYLQPGPCGIDQFGYEACELVATTHFYNQWNEQAP